MSSKRLRWKLQPRETGLRAVGAGPRSSWLHDGEKRYACVSAFSSRAGRSLGWYWVAGWDSAVPHKNTCNETPCATAEEAKAAALKYVKEHMEEAGNAQR